jgi:uncharacterized protein YecA (UPF0149 family)
VVGASSSEYHPNNQAAGVQVNEHKVVFQKPGVTQEEVFGDMRDELKKLFKTPRNAPCPCSSGKKFKKCCLRLIP